MILDLSEIIKNEESKISFDGKLDVQSVEFMGEEYIFPEPLYVKGEVRNNSKNLELTGEVTGKVSVSCARCAKPFDADVRYRIKEILVREDGQVASDSDAVFYTGYEIDITDIVKNGFLMNIPSRYLCREDCKGLCPHCGKDLNEGECDCDSEVQDPRWAALAEILKDTTTE